MDTSSITAMIADQANAQGVDPNLAIALAWQESRLNPNTPPGADGEIGLFQLEPATALALGVDPYDLSQNISGGIRYLRSQLDRFGGNVAAALAAYNAGPGRVSKAIESAGSGWFGSIPSSTKVYVASILGQVGGSGAAVSSSSAPEASVQVAAVAPTDWSAPPASPLPISRSEFGLTPGLALGAAAVLLLLFW